MTVRFQYDIPGFIASAIITATGRIAAVSVLARYAPARVTLRVARARHTFISIPLFHPTDLIGISPACSGILPRLLVAPAFCAVSALHHHIAAYPVVAAIEIKIARTRAASMVAITSTHRPRTIRRIGGRSNDDCRGRSP